MLQNSNISAGAARPPRSTESSHTYVQHHTPIRFVSYKLEIHCRALRIRSILVPDVRTVPHRGKTR